jgi:hypothetical protein
MYNEVKDDFKFTILVSSVVLLYGIVIYIVLSIMNIYAENIILISILVSSCILTYDFTIRFCDLVYATHLKNKNANHLKNKNLMENSL